MASDYPWYEVAGKDDGLQQGDCLDSCPMIVSPEFTLRRRRSRVPSSLDAEEGRYRVKVKCSDYDLIVMTQSCDLVNNKIESVLVCRHWSLEELSLKNPALNDYKLREKIRQGDVPGYHMLAACESKNMQHPIRVVDFRSATSLPFDFLKEFVAAQGERLRLLLPYRERLSQAFARFIMRVGLPNDIPPFKK